MSDSYQAVYDAVRSRFYGDFSRAFDQAVRENMDISHAVAMLQSDLSYNITVAREDMTRPSVLYRPSIGPDGDKWCVLLGDDLMNGIAGFGDTVEEAMLAFDKAFKEERTPVARRLAREAAS